VNGRARGTAEHNWGGGDETGHGQGLRTGERKLKTERFGKAGGGPRSLARIKGNS